MGAHNAGIHEMQVPIDQAGGISIGLERLEHTLPDPALAPSVEAARHGPDRTVALGQVAPGCACAQHPENAIENGAMLVVRAACPRPLWGQQRRQTLPLLIRQLITRHAL